MEIPRTDHAHGCTRTPGATSRHTRHSEAPDVRRRSNDNSSQREPEAERRIGDQKDERKDLSVSPDPESHMMFDDHAPGADCY
jgi:hypothetical protein